MWEIAWSPIVDVNGISSLEDVDSWISNCRDRGPWFVDKAKPGKGESKSVDKVEEIFAMLM